MLINLHPVPIAELTHMPHSVGRSAVPLLDQPAASVAHFSLFPHVLVWGGVCVYIWGYPVLLTGKCGGGDGSPGLMGMFAVL